DCGLIFGTAASAARNRVGESPELPLSSALACGSTPMSRLACSVTYGLFGVRPVQEIVMVLPAWAPMTTGNPEPANLHAGTVAAEAGDGVAATVPSNAGTVSADARTALRRRVRTIQTPLDQRLPPARAESAHDLASLRSTQSQPSRR